eukprot:136189-Chlamydomonas_euryale.AAC.2
MPPTPPALPLPSAVPAPPPAAGSSSLFDVMAMAAAASATTPSATPPASMHQACTSQLRLHVFAAAPRVWKPGCGNLGVETKGSTPFQQSFR